MSPAPDPLGSLDLDDQCFTRYCGSRQSLKQSGPAPQVWVGFETCNSSCQEDAIATEDPYRSLITFAHGPSSPGKLLTWLRRTIS